MNLARLENRSGILQHLRALTGESPVDPFQLLFPVGIVFAVLGVVAWTLHGLGVISAYPGIFHAQWMVGGFLMSFSAGFLMTAVPRFTGGESCRLGELFVAVALACAQALGLGFSAALFLFLILFGAKRFLEREYDPPPYFIFVALGLILGFLGSAGIALAEIGVPMPVPLAALRVYLLQGVLLCFIVGIGARLVRVLLGYEMSPLVQIARPGSKSGPIPFLPETPVKVYGSFALMAAGFVLEASPGNEIVGRWLRALATSAVAFSAWHLHRWPPRRGALVWGLFLGCWCVMLGTWAYALFPGWEVHSGHVLYVGGFGTLAVMVGSRVTLAHGGYPLTEEARSIPLRITWILLLLAMATRVAAPFTPSYANHLAYAGGAGALAFLIWGIWMMRRIRSANSSGV